MTNKHNSKEEFSKMSINWDNGIFENYLESIDITDRGTMTTFGKKVPYVKFNAKLSHFPKKNISGIVSVVDTDKKNQRLIISLNDQKHYSQLITSEFYRNVKESNSKK